MRIPVSQATVAACWPAWQFVRAGHFYLEDVAGLPDDVWFSDALGQVVSNRTAGVILAGVPAQLLLRTLDVDSTVPGVATAVLATSLATPNLSVVLRCWSGSYGLGRCPDDHLRHSAVDGRRRPALDARP